jgi:hypothetical protein
MICFVGEKTEAILGNAYLLWWEIFHCQCEVQQQSLVSVLRQGNLA